jgi:hypothetical protein
MSAHAIVIGIDNYSHAEWRLTGAVRDAIAFARWAVTAGGVDPSNLTLLVSPLAEDPPLAERLQASGGAPDLSARARPATRGAILDTFDAYQSGAGKDADRLWFYYAGHGLAAAGQGTTAGPLIVPADVENLSRYVNQEPVGLEVFRGGMEDTPPKEQFYFIDACRDVLPPIGRKSLSQQLIWDVRDVTDDDLSTQAIFFATTAGARAKELRGHGLFGRALLAALRGLGPNLSPPTAPPAPGQVARRRLLFESLVGFVKEAVMRATKDLPGIQVPYGRVNRLTGTIVVAEFAPHELPTAKLTAILDPQAARDSARIEFLQWDDNTSAWITRTANPAPLGPPVPELATFDLRGGSHFLRITATGFQETTPEVLVYEDKRIPIELQPIPAITRSGAPVLERVHGVEAAEATTGSLIVRSPDRLARVSVFDGGGNERGREYESLELDDLAPGPYRVVAELTGSALTEQIVYVRAGETVEAVVDIPAAPVSAELAQDLEAHGISLVGDYAEFSENLGPVGNARFGSILAYAAWGARWPESEGFRRLRSIGVDPLPTLTPEGSAVQVLIGDATRRDGSLLESVRVQLEPIDSNAPPLSTGNRRVVIGGGPTPMPLEPLGTLAGAAQTSAILPVGPIQVRVELPDVPSATFPLSLIPGFITVLVLSREDDEVEVQQYLNPIDPMRPTAEGFDRPMTDDVRLIELAWRALEGRDPLDAIEHNGLLEGKRSNPLLGIIAGYRMSGTDRADEFLVMAQPPARREKTASALWNLVQFFPGLPDVHVLAGIYDPERRDAHFQRAMATGTPVLAEGFWRLVDWLTADAMRQGIAPPVLGRAVLPGTVWTAFTEAPPAARVDAIRIVPSVGRPSVGDASASRAEAIARSVGRVEIEGAPEPFVCSCALVGPRLAICPRYVVVMFADEAADGTWTLRRGVRVRFDAGETTSDRTVARVVRTLRPEPGAPMDGGTLPRETLERSWPVVLELSEDAAAPPLAPAAEAPALGRRVAVIGFPTVDARIPSESFARYFSGASGEKHFMPGTVVRAAGESWTFDYDCFTAPGVSGGPVIDLETGTLTGMHVAGLPAREGRKRGIGMSLVKWLPID